MIVLDTNVISEAMKPTANPALFSGILGDRLSKNPRYASVLQWLTGCVLVGLGVRLALSGRY